MLPRALLFLFLVCAGLSLMIDTPMPMAIAP